MSARTCHVHVVDGVTLAVARGELDLARTARFRSALREAVDLGTAETVVDLEDVTLIDAGAAGVLARQQARAEAAGRSLRAVAASGIVLEVLEVLGLAKALRAYDGRECAPPRPQLACCTSPVVGAGTADEALEAPTHGLPNEAVGALLTEAAALPFRDPQAERLRRQAVEISLPAAQRLARRYHQYGERLDDLRQVAALGLVKAVNGFDPDKGHEFSDYAVPTILGELRRYFRDKGWGLRVPRALQELWLDSRAAQDRLTQRLGHQPAPDEVAAELGVPAGDVRAAYLAADCYSPQSLSTPLGDQIELGDVLGGEDPGFEWVDNWESLRPALAALPERLRCILALRFEQELTQAQIAQQVGLSQMHVSRLLTQAYAELRTVLLTDGDPASTG